MRPRPGADGRDIAYNPSLTQIADERKTMSPDESVMPMGLEEALYFQRLWNECGDAREFACRVLSLVMNAVMDEQAQLACGAARGERTRARTNSRNGYRPRTLKTATGDVELRIPKLREGSYFPEEMLTRWSRVDVSVAALVREMYVSGVSTRKVERVAARLGISSLSSSEVSRLCGELDAEVEALRGRDLSRTPCCYLWLDATYMSCREGSVVSSHAVVTAIGLGADGRKHVLGVEAMDTESEEGWNGFLAGLKARGLSGVRLVVSDAHAGLVAAIARQLQGCAWQRCVTHLQRNLQSAMAGKPQASKECVAKLVHAACYESDPELSRAIWEEAAPWVVRASPRAAEIFSAAEDSALAFQAFPGAHWAKLRTNNVQERANREIKRRCRVVQSFPSVGSMLRLSAASILSEEGRWATQRVFSEESAALGFRDPGPREAPSRERREALERRAARIVAEITEAYGLRKE